MKYLDRKSTRTRIHLHTQHSGKTVGRKRRPESSYSEHGEDQDGGIRTFNAGSCGVRTIEKHVRTHTPTTRPDSGPNHTARDRTPGDVYGCEGGGAMCIVGGRRRAGRGPGSGVARCGVGNGRGIPGGVRRPPAAGEGYLRRVDGEPRAQG